VVLGLVWYDDVLIAAGVIATLGGAYTALKVWGKDLASAFRSLRGIAHRRRSLPDPAGRQEPTQEQVRVLNTVYEYFLDNAKRAPFRMLDKQLDLQGIKLRPLAESMPPGLLSPDVSRRGGFYRDEDDLLVTVEGLRYCIEGKEALDLFARALAYMAKREKPFVPSGAVSELLLSGPEFRQELRLTPQELEQLWLMLNEYEWHARRGLGRAPDGEWHVVVDTENVRPFRGIRNGDEYLRARAGESFEHQLDAEEAVVRFTLIADTPSFELDGSLVTLTVENEGPGDEFEATVGLVTNARQAQTPWYVRWRGTNQQSKEILTGGHWVLEICRDDSTHGYDEKNYTPGWVFLLPDGEMFVAPDGLGVLGMPYGYPMRVTIRVTPRSQPQRALEDTVTVQITQQGKQVLWDYHRVPL